MIKLLLPLAATSCIVSAQVPNVLLEACNAVSDPSIRLECFKQASARSSSTSKVSDEAVRRAFIGLQGSLNTGVSLLSYQASLNEISKELSVFESEAPSSSAIGLSKLREALDTYADAGRFWGEAISFYARRDNSLAYAGGLPVRQVGLEWMIAKHSLPTRNADLFGFHLGVPADAGRRAMWLKAQALANDGLVFLRDPQAAATALAIAAAKDAPPQASSFGITVQPIIEGGLKVMQLSSDAPVGLQVGDIILSIDNTKLYTLEDFQTAIAKLRAVTTPLPVVVFKNGMEKNTELIPNQK